MRLIAIIQPTETRELTADADDYDTAKAALDAQVPEGWRVTAYRTA